MKHLLSARLTIAIALYRKERKFGKQKHQAFRLALRAFTP